MKLAVVVQRYGAQINGGAELHARYIVDLLARQHQVEVLTTCARDYVTWRNETPEGTETVRGVAVRRFPVSRERDPEEFGQRQAHVFERPHSIADEVAWLESEGPTSPALIAHLGAHAADYDYIFFFSYRYYHAYHGARAVPGKAILVPTAERDETIGLSIFGPIFRGVRAIMYNSPEERAMIQAATRNTHVPGVVVGVGSDVHRNPAPGRFRRKYKIADPFVVYVGRIDENKGCRELFAHFTSYRPRLGQRLKLVLIGNSILSIPDHPNVHHLGFVSDQDKFDAMAAADALVMPSYYESLSMVALEAWALGRPVLANGRCDVLRGQCIRSRAGLYYETFEEFAETLFTLTTNRPLAEALGDNGRQYFEQHYAWPVIERKYLDMLKHLAQEDAAGRVAVPIEPLPGWLTRRRKVIPPAREVLATLPKGPALGDDASGRSGSASSSSPAAAADTESGGASPLTAFGAAAMSSGGASSRASTSMGGGRAAGADAATGAGGARSSPDRPREGRHRRDGRNARGGRDAREGRTSREGRDTREERKTRDGSRQQDARPEGRTERRDGERGAGRRDGERGERRDSDRRERRDGDRGERDADRRERRDAQRPDSQRGERGDRGERDADRGERRDTQRPDRQRGERGDRAERGDVGERGADRGERRDTQRPDRQRGERGDRAERGDVGERGADRGERRDTQRPDSQRGERGERGDVGERGERDDQRQDDRRQDGQRRERGDRGEHPGDERREAGERSGGGGRPRRDGRGPRSRRPRGDGRSGSGSGSNSGSGSRGGGGQ